MSTTPFIKEELWEVGFFKKLLGISHKPNAVIELKNLLAAKTPTEISIEEVAAIAGRYKIDFRKRFSDDIASMYEKYIRFCLEDRELSQAELDNLSALKRLLMITDPEAKSILNKVASEVYKKAVDEVLSDGTISESEKEFLKNLETRLTIPEDISQRIYDETRTNIVQSKLHLISADQRVSPEEWKELDLLAKNLGVAVQFDDATKHTLDKYRLFWLIENGTPPDIPVSINLQRGESCYFQTSCEWHEFRKVRLSYGYAGPTLRVKIAKGLYWRAGHIAVRPFSQDELTKIDAGTLYLTNKRLIFVGTRKGTSIRCSKILDFEPYQDGVFIQKDSGKSPFLGFTENVDLFCITLGRVLRDT
jgi:hypothetical protein